MDVTAHVSVVGPCSPSLSAYRCSGRRGPEELADFLPPRSDPGYLSALTELVRADLEHHWAAGTPVGLDSYRTLYPELFTDADAVAALVAVESHLRNEFDTPRPLSGRRSGFRLTGIDQTPPPAALPPRGQYERTRPIPAPRATDARSLRDPSLTASRPTRPSPEVSRPASRFPVVGDTFCGFRLIDELGSGAFARVFLAEQTALAGRRVALKVTTRPTREPQQLAKLRHSNVVPIYSVHDDPPLQAVCMPFLGRQTLADLVKEYRTTGVFPGTAAHSTTVAAAGGTTLDLPQKSGVRPALPPAAPAAVPARVADPAEASHPALVLRLVARLVEGLAHAHEVGILHLDLKPANVLLADDGQPLLLDFNLAFDVRAGDRERAGGTLPYMAPEQLDEYVERGDTRVDQRTDLYALGVILFELLTGRQPFPIPPGGKANPVAMAAVRRAGPPSVRAINPAVSPAVDSIVRMLLQPDPARRYQSARDLLTDLDRHRQNRPLAVAPDTSVPERLRKWQRRHPRLLTHLLLVGTLLTAGGLGVAAFRESHARRTAAETGKARAVRGDLARLRVGLVAREEVAARTAALKDGRAVLAAYGLPDADDWFNRPAVRALSDTDRTTLADDLGELALLMAHAEWLGGLGKGADEHVTAVARALVWNRAAETCYTGRTAPEMLTVQRKQLAGGVPYQPIDPVRLSATDLYLSAAMIMATGGRYDKAIGPLQTLTQQNPSHYAGQFELALCRQKTWDLPAALERFQVAQALADSDPRPAYNRGLILLHDARNKREKYRRAEAEFTDAIRRDPTHADSYKHRAVARTALPDYKGALADLEKALELGASAVQIYSLRAGVYGCLGNKAAAEADRKAAAAAPLTDEMDYLVRGTLRKKTDPAGALADFEKAAELNPNYLRAWQNQAHVLADVLDQQTQALAAQEKAVACDPNFTLARSGRAVLYARLGRRAEAHADAQAALVLSEEPLVTYQVACAYALTATKNPEDLPRAIGYFRKALRDGYRDFPLIERDPDLKAVRNLPEFRDALDAAKKLVK
jgi:serine/threonine protein kinase/tetratricopeptide (TPR) repeat protein